MEQEDFLPSEKDAMISFIIHLSQDLNLLATEPMTDFHGIMKRAIRKRSDLSQQPSQTPHKKPSSKDEREAKGLPEAEEKPIPQSALNNQPLKKNVHTEVTNDDLLACLSSINQNLEVTNTLLGQFINSFQSWHQADIPREPSAV
jgi:hypothetical protein